MVVMGSAMVADSGLFGMNLKVYFVFVLLGTVKCGLTSSKKGLVLIAVRTILWAWRVTRLTVAHIVSFEAQMAVSDKSRYFDPRLVPIP